MACHQSLGAENHPEMSRAATPTRERFADKLILKTTTAASGTGWVALGNANATAAVFAGDGLSVKMTNLTAVSLSYAFGVVGNPAPTGETYEIPAGCSDVIYGMGDIGEVFFRETGGTSTGAKTFKAAAYK